MTVILGSLCDIGIEYGAPLKASNIKIEYRGHMDRRDMEGRCGRSNEMEKKSLPQQETRLTRWRRITVGKNCNSNRACTFTEFMEFIVGKTV